MSSTQQRGRTGGGGGVSASVASSQRILEGQTRARVEDKMEKDKKSVEIPEVRALPGRPPGPVLELQKTKEGENVQKPRHKNDVSC